MPSEPQPAHHLPIRVVLPRQGSEKRVTGGGGEPVPFKPLTPEFRTQLKTSVEAIREVALAQRAHTRFIPVRVRLHPRASAKSHRPDELFNRTCPIVGAGALGELFLQASPEGLRLLAETIGSADAKQAAKDISAIETIEPITPHFRKRGLTASEILETSPRTDSGFATKVRLFDFAGADDQASIEKDFLGTCSSRGLTAGASAYSPSSRIFAVTCKTVDDVEALANVVGVRSVSRMPLVQMIRPKTISPSGLPPALPTRPKDDTDVPVVVVVDSGVATGVTGLDSWLVGSYSSVAPNERNPEHGTFVAGLIVWGDRLNPLLKCIGPGPCAVFDLQVLPNNDPQHGDIGRVVESEFLETLEQALKTHANRFKVWNLSLNTNEVCSPDEFSSFAQQLDDLQERYQVVFVISAGNYNQIPRLDYPRTKAQLSAGRITAPADSVLGVTVGAVSHYDHGKGGPGLHQPSSFSRHGAGPNHIIKPDLVHFGGTSSVDGSHTIGIRSIRGAGTSEDLGTSFSAPLVSRSLAQVMHYVTPTPSPVLGRALLTHHARDPRTGGRVPDGEEDFFGFGMPESPPYCLQCAPHTTTLVFEDTLRPGFYLEWDDFPYPPSLRRGDRYYGQVWMTVALAPSRGGRWGTEYCESHVDAHFGVFRDVVIRKTGEIKAKFTGLVPPEHKNPGRLYESYQVATLRKWAPVRTYHGDLSKGERGTRWRLKVQLLTRHGIDEAEIARPQPFALIITIADPQERAPVYDEMARLIRSKYQARDLAIRPSVRVPIRGPEGA